jgi:hypothetical protein
VIVRMRFGFVGATWIAAIGCAPPPPPPVEAPKPVVVERPPEAAPAATSDVGGMNEDRVQQTLQHIMPAITSCFTKGQAHVPYLAGDVRFAVRVAMDGSARWAYVKESNLGERETEACMLGVLKATTWPKPVGGEGLLEGPFTFDPNPEQKPPTEWKPEQLGPAFYNVKSALVQCRRKAGTKAMKVTMYVNTSGKAFAVGVSSADEKGEDAADCVLEALKKPKFRSPGGYAAKVTLSIE